ncbi:MAG: DNA polymerase III subunit gamma/tau, partial [Planctomycetaceae bacterium]|nr:DNA polymerase III subunit gamma/tau [Planctomycetaceae bacterium]
AYLFTGARGVGKTSMARILAKALNCPNVENGVPCNNCEICNGITRGSDMDVQEIDGASNRRIDDIRALRANASVRSMRTQYKLYIIDEVHMLVREAFNALLKTLEEPPPGVKFVFCTTEPHKIPDTILSRCQRFDFSTIETASICERLRVIAEQEGYQVEPEALELVARRAGGSMRDSQSLFDQLLAFGEQTISAADVHRLLGTAGDDRLLAILQNIVSHETAAALREFDVTVASGVQPGELVDQLVNCLRDLMIVSSGADSLALQGLGEGSRADLAQSASRWGLRTIVSAIEILAECRVRMGTTPFGRALAEAAIARLSLLEDLEALGSLIAQMKSGSGLSLEVQQTVHSGPPRIGHSAPASATSPSRRVDSPGSAGQSVPSSGSAPTTAGNSSSAGLPADDTPSDSSHSAGPPANRPQSHPSQPDRQGQSPGQAGGASAEYRPASPSALSESRSREQPPADGPAAEPSGSSSANVELSSQTAHASHRMNEPGHFSPQTDVQQGAATAVAGQENGPDSDSTFQTEAPVESRTEPPVEAQTAPEDSESPPASGRSLKELGPTILPQLIEQADDNIRGHLKAASELAISGPNTLDLVFPAAYRFSMQYCERPEMHSRLERIASQIAGQAVQIQYRIIESAVAETTTEQAPVDKGNRLEDFALQDPLVQAAISVFGATCIRSERIPDRPASRE